MAETATPLYRLANVLLDGALADFVVERRSNGKSWRAIAMDLWVQTDQAVEVTPETLRSWFGDLAEDVPA